MGLAAEDLKQIREYISNELPKILEERGLLKKIGEWELRERIVRVEEELKAQRELMKQGFELMEKRFEQVDKRFEQVDKRFEQIDKRFEQIDKRFEYIESRIEELSRKIFHFMIWSFGFTATVAAIVIGILK